MLRRSIVAVALCALAGCQDYNFNPVGKCVIQPGSSRVTLTNLSTADILFVVDDSGSMAPEQARLAKNFRAFIDALAAAQAARINQDGLEPFEFHIAVTTSSVFEAWQPNSTVTCSGTPASCDVIQTHYSTPHDPIACDTSGATCDELIQKYFFQTTDSTKPLTFCQAPGVAVSGTSFPGGDFVGAAGNPKVLHFTKDLDWAHWPAQPDQRIVDLISQFQQNINVGICGSGMEQHLEASYLAVKKALRQDGLSQVAGVAATDWPHAGAKLVVVWVGDEDDCSNPKDPLRSLAFTNARSGPGSDVCMDAERNGGAVPSSEDPRGVSLFPLSRYEDFFTGLGKTFSAAFVYSAVKDASGAFNTGNINTDANPPPPSGPNLLCKCECPTECATCADNAPDPICRTPATCGGNSYGNRINTFAKDLRAKGVETFEASVCDKDWATTLQSIANLVKPARGLNLPTQPATSDVAVLRIESADASSSRFCQGPGDGKDWNFVDCTTGDPEPAGTTSSCITIDHTSGRQNTCCNISGGSCSDAKPGETYIMQYLGRVPQSGCAIASDCTTALGGSDKDWQCLVTEPGNPGTCVCQGS